MRKQCPLCFFSLYFFQSLLYSVAADVVCRGATYSMYTSLRGMWSVVRYVGGKGDQEVGCHGSPTVRAEQSASAIPLLIR